MADVKLKHYRIVQPYYRQGVLHEAGSVVSIPAGEKPSFHWTEVDASGNPLSGEASAPAAPRDGSPPTPKAKGVL
jgi:hypothetical protein